MADNKDKKVLNVPALRFPEFTDEWKEVLFASNLERLENGANYNTNDKDGVPMSRIETISTGRIDYTKVGHCSTPQKIEHYIMRYGDILFSHINSLKHIGKTAYYSAEEPLYHGMNLLLFRCKNNVDSKFFFFLINNTHFIRKCQILAKQAVNQASISTSDLKKIKVYIPDINEQSKIMKFLSLIEKRIELQNKIIEDLKKLKSAIVETILCKQGGVLLKLGDVGSFIRGLTYSSEDISEDINATTVIRANNLNYGNNVSKEDVVYVNKKPTEIQILRKGDIVICMANGSSSLVGKNSYYPFDDRQSTIGAFCGIYRSPQPLVKWLMQSQRYRRLVYQSIQGGNGTIANLNGDNILNMTFRVVEDKKSVSILSALVMIENSIAVNEKLQELCSMQKEYLLQHLFI